MTLAYQRAATPASDWEAWGTLVYGTTRIALRKLVVFGGIALLLLTLLLRTGEAGLGQLWASALLALPLLAVGSLTRTVGLRLLGRLLLLGAALMGVMYLLAVVLITPLLGDISRPRDFVVPALEQLLVMLPLVVLVWGWRDGRAWSLGATDLLLAGVAVGIGFGLMEQAYLRSGSDWLEWLPLVGYHPLRLTPAHAIWAGLGGATLGLGLLLRSRGPIWLAVAASGSLLGFLDHAANNNTNWGDGLSGLLNAITLNGWLAVLAFLALAAACIGADIYVLRKLEPLPHRAMPPRGPGLAGVLATWEFLTVKRRLAIADFHWRRLPEAIRRDVGREAELLSDHLASGDVLPPLATSAPDSEWRARATSSAREGIPGDRSSGPPPASGGAAGGALLFCVLLGAAAGALLAFASVAFVAFPAAFVGFALDVGGNCDAVCLGSSGGGAGGAGGPGSDRKQEKSKQEKMDEIKEKWRRENWWREPKARFEVFLQEFSGQRDGGQLPLSMSDLARGSDPSIIYGQPDFDSQRAGE